MGSIRAIGHPLFGRSGCALQRVPMHRRCRRCPRSHSGSLKLPGASAQTPVCACPPACRGRDADRCGTHRQAGLRRCPPESRLQGLSLHCRTVENARFTGTCPQCLRHSCCRRAFALQRRVCDPRSRGGERPREPNRATGPSAGSPGGGSPPTKPHESRRACRNRPMRNQSPVFLAFRLRAAASSGRSRLPCRRDLRVRRRTTMFGM